MSNPGVLVLDNGPTKAGIFNRFEIEDNIGESIHLHIDKMRFDFTINEFLDFSLLIRESLESLGIMKDYTIDNFDAHFLKEISYLLPDLSEIKIEEIKISSLLCISRSKLFGKINLLSLNRIQNTDVYKYLIGAKNNLRNYPQYNYINIDNLKRVENLLNSIKNEGYPIQDKYIILFEGEHVVRDGQHRLAILSNLNGVDSKVKVMRFYFNKKYYPVKIIKQNSKSIIKYFIYYYFYKITLRFMPKNGKKIIKDILLGIKKIFHLS